MGKGSTFCFFLVTRYEIRKNILSLLLRVALFVVDCIVVILSRVTEITLMSHNKTSEEQLALNGVKKPRGRPKTGQAKSAAERQREYRRRQRITGKFELRRQVTSRSHQQIQYLEEQGLDIDFIIELATTVNIAARDLDSQTGEAARWLIAQADLAKKRNA